MLCISIRVSLIPVGLAGLRPQDQGRCVGRLQAESEVQQDEGVGIEMREIYHVHYDPDAHNEGLRDQKCWRPKEAGKRLRLYTEPVASKRPRKMLVCRVKSEMMSDALCV